MTTFQFAECQILSPTINSRQELLLKIKVKSEDYDLETFRELANNHEGQSFACVLAPFQSEKVEDPLPKLRMQLAMTVKEYCEVSGNKEVEELDRLYERNNLSTRKLMTEEQLRHEIESYRAGILQYSS